MRDRKTVNLVADVIAPVAVIIVTIALFVVFMPENPGVLFYANLIYTSVLEAVLFAYLLWLPKCGDSVALKWLCGVYSIYYIVISLAWMLSFGLVLSRFCPIKLYFAVIAVFTVLWILINALSFKVDNIHEEAVAEQTDNRQKLSRINSRAEMLTQQFRLLLTAHPELSSASASVDALCRSLATLSPTVMSDSTAINRIKSICSGLEEILCEPVSDEMFSRLKEFADQSLITLNYIKKSNLK